MEYGKCLESNCAVAARIGEVARYKLGHLLSQASPYLLLLSATPHNGKTEPFLRLVRLLDADAFPNAKSIVKEQVAPYLIRTEKREAIDNNGNKLFKNRITHLVALNWDERHTMQRMVTSSTAAILQSLKRRLQVLKTQSTHLGNLTEEKLSAILAEMGVDKYSDVLDSEVAECDFTDAYMNTIAKPYKLEESLRPIESEMRQQLKNSNQYKEIIREGKDLQELVGQESDFDVDAALRLMFAYYDGWQGLESMLIDRIGITDAELTKHLKTDITQDRFSPILSVGIKDFPNEEGYFMLWELSISDDVSSNRIVLIFVNIDFVLRLMAGKRLMEQFLDVHSKLTVKEVSNLMSEDYQRLEKMSMDFAYDTFVNLREKQLQKNQESYNKYMYALKLRTEAADHIGIENIKKPRLLRLEREREEVERSFKAGKQVYPDFRLSLLVRLEA